MVSRNPAHKLDDNEGLGDFVDDNDHQDQGKSPDSRTQFSILRLTNSDGIE